MSILLLSGVGAYLLLGNPREKGLRWATILYGIGLALTFDEFGLWLHLGGSYWQRASVGAVIIVAALIGLVAFAPSLKRLEARHFWGFIVLLLAVIGFGVVVVIAGGHSGDLMGPKLHELELCSSR